MLVVLLKFIELYIITILSLIPLLPLYVEMYEDVDIIVLVSPISFSNVQWQFVVFIEIIIMYRSQ